MHDRLIHHGRFLDYYERDGWEFVRRANAHAVVAIAALTDNDEVVLIEQVRKPLGESGEPVIELPAGLVGDEHEADDIVTAARRELVEETGFDAEEIRIAGRGPSSGGLTDELITMTVARGLRRVGEGGGVDDEDITVHLVPMAAVDGWLADRSERLIDPKVWAGLYLLRRLQ